VARRLNQKSMGFQAHILTAAERSASELLSQVHPEDLIKFGMIPEFVGRVPVVANLHELDRDALVRILTEPKNSLVKQYETMLSFEGVELRLHRLMRSRRSRTTRSREKWELVASRSSSKS